jgi:hypothetical protein
MFLENIPTVYELKNVPEVVPMNEPEFYADVYKKWSLGVTCSQYNQTYFSISNGNNKKIEFVVKSKPKQQVTDFFKNVFGVDLKVRKFEIL